MLPLLRDVLRDLACFGFTSLVFSVVVFVVEMDAGAVLNDFQGIGILPIKNQTKNDLYLFLFFCSSFSTIGTTLIGEVTPPILFLAGDLTLNERFNAEGVALSGSSF